MKLVVEPLKYVAVSKTHGFAVTEFKHLFRILYVERREVSGVSHFFQEAISRSFGRDHVYASRELAEYVIQHDIRPLYVGLSDELNKLSAPILEQKIVE